MQKNKSQTGNTLPSSSVICQKAMTKYIQRYMKKFFKFYTHPCHQGKVNAVFLNMEKSESLISNTSSLEKFFEDALNKTKKTITRDI